MTRILGFGETVPGYEVPVLNEREARAGAGILFAIGLVAFQTAFVTGDFTMTRLVILGFAIDFAIRVFINPRYAPVLIAGRFMVRKQVPEYTGAPQKRFAWALGLAIALFMLVWTSVLNWSGPVALLGCLTCLVLLMFESAFGICVGCKIYNRIYPGQARLCPSGTCEADIRAPITRMGTAQGAVLAGFVALLVGAAPIVAALDAPRLPGMAADRGARDCTVPEFAKRIGHEEMWKKHNGCL
jgi:hypothetical protein